MAQARSFHSLSEFANQNSFKFFRITGIDQSFLEKNPDIWVEDESFQLGLKRLQGMKPTNDIAERGVKLIEDFNSSITKNEEQKQFLLQQITEHRKNFPNPNKSTLITMTDQ